MHPDHAVLLGQLKAAARPAPPGVDRRAYAGGGHACLGAPIPERRRLVRAWLAAHKAAAPRQVLALADSLMAGDTNEELSLGPMLAALHPPTRRALDPARVERWLDRLQGWAEVDGLCQSTLEAEDLLADWPAWSALIGRLAADANLNKRRAALVLLTRPVARSGDPRLAALAFRTIDRLRAERPILITKAVSWLLRALCARHAAEVAAYLDAHAAALPAVAVRETRRKLQTGRKSADTSRAGGRGAPP